MAVVGNNGRPARAFPLAACQGDCDHDGECQVSLRLSCSRSGRGGEATSSLRYFFFRNPRALWRSISWFGTGRTQPS